MSICFLYSGATCAALVLPLCCNSHLHGLRCSFVGGATWLGPSLILSATEKSAWSRDHHRYMYHLFSWRWIMSVLFFQHHRVPLLLNFGGQDTIDPRHETAEDEISVTYDVQLQSLCPLKTRISVIFSFFFFSSCGSPRMQQLSLLEVIWTFAGRVTPVPC